ncbi:MAG TPA: SGNH/GDSL hydrolase family protein [Gammaproteobacteria bacterium]|nr:SGNH/GDSL hydrolase family protein [Gammaproteobacteria bacterium]
MRIQDLIGGTLGFALAAACLAAAPARAAPPAPSAVEETGAGDAAPPTDVFVLGDSLSDIGNAAALADYVLGEPLYPAATVGLCNPMDIFVLHRNCDALIYGKSRATNGPVAVELLEEGLGLPPLEPSYHTVPDRPAHGTDYAVAGATARGAGVDDLATQVEILRVDRGPVLPDGALYVVMIGGNDGLAALRSAGEARVGISPSEGSDEIVAAAVAAIGDAVEALVDAGARRLVVTNLPNLAAVPIVGERARSLGLDEAEARSLAADVTGTFNTALAARLAAAQTAHPEARIEPFDLYDVLERIRAADAAAGVDVTDACFDSEAYRTSILAERRFNPACAPDADGGAPRFDAFFFWDGLHPTASVHAALADALLAFYRGS